MNHIVVNNKMMVAECYLMAIAMPLLISEAGNKIDICIVDNFFKLSFVSLSDAFALPYRRRMIVWTPLKPSLSYLCY